MTERTTYLVHGTHRRPGAKDFFPWPWGAITNMPEVLARVDGLTLADVFYESIVPADELWMVAQDLYGWFLTVTPNDEPDTAGEVDW